MTHELWAGLNTHIFNFLQSVTLAELVRQQTEHTDVAVLQDHRSSGAASRSNESAAVA